MFEIVSVNSLSLSVWDPDHFLHRPGVCDGGPEPLTVACHGSVDGRTMALQSDYPSPYLNLLAKEVVALILAPVVLDLTTFGKLCLALRSSRVDSQRKIPRPIVELVTEIFCSGPDVTLFGRHYAWADDLSGCTELDPLVDLPGSFFSELTCLETLYYPRCTNWKTKDIAALPGSLYEFCPHIWRDLNQLISVPFTI